MTENKSRISLSWSPSRWIWSPQKTPTMINCLGNAACLSSRGSEEVLFYVGYPIAYLDDLFFLCWLSESSLIHTFILFSTFPILLSLLIISCCLNASYFYFCLSNSHVWSGNWISCSSSQILSSFLLSDFIFKTSGFVVYDTSCPEYCYILFWLGFIKISGTAEI